MTQVSTQGAVCVNIKLLLHVKSILTRVDSNNSFGVNCCRHTVPETVKANLGICDEENFEKGKQDKKTKKKQLWVIVNVYMKTTSLWNLTSMLFLH